MTVKENRKYEKKNSSISKSKTYEKMGDFWDSHDLTDFSSKTKKAHFDVDIKSERIYCSLNKEISNELQILANKQGVSLDLLVNKIFIRFMELTSKNKIGQKLVDYGIKTIPLKNFQLLQMWY